MKSEIILPFFLIFFLSLSIFQSISQKVPMKNSIKIQTPEDRATRVSRDVDIYRGTDNKGNRNKNYGPRSRPPYRPGRQNKMNLSHISNQKEILETKEKFSQEDRIVNNTKSETRNGESIGYKKYPYSRNLGNIFKRDDITHLFTSADNDHRTSIMNYQDKLTKYYKNKSNDRRSNNYPVELEGESVPALACYRGDRVSRHFPERQMLAGYQKKDAENMRASSVYQIDNIRDYGNFRNSYGERPIGNVWSSDSEKFPRSFFNDNTDFTKDFYQQSAIQIVDSPIFNTNFEASKPSPGSGFDVKPTAAEMPTKYSLSEWNEKIASNGFQYVPEFDIKGNPISSPPTIQTSKGLSNGNGDINLNKGFQDFIRHPEVHPIMSPTSNYIYTSAYKNSDFFGLKDVSKMNNYPALPNSLQFPKAEPTTGFLQTIIVPVPQPYPVKVPVTRPVAVPIIKEIKVPVEKKVPYPVYKNILYPVEKRVPVPIEKHVTVPVMHPYPVKIPIIKNIYHHSNEDSGDNDSEIWEHEDLSHQEWKSMQKRPQKNDHSSYPWKIDRPKKKPYRESWLKDQPVNDEEESWGHNSDQESWESIQSSESSRFTRERNRPHKIIDIDRERPRKNSNRWSWEKHRPDEYQHRESWNTDRFQIRDDSRPLKHSQYRSRENERYFKTSDKYPKQKSPRDRARHRGRE